MTGIAFADVSLRLLTVGQLLLTSIVIGRGRAPVPIRVVTVLLLAGVVCFLALAPIRLYFSAPVPGWVLLPLAAQSVPLMLWVYAHLLFERPLPRPPLIAGAMVLVTCWGLHLMIGLGHPQRHLGVALVQNLASLAFLAHALRIALAERGDDLIEKRRRLRVGFVLVVGLFSVMVIALDIMFGFVPGQPMMVLLGQSASIFIATTAMGTALLQSDPDLLFDPARPLPAPALSPAEQVLRGKLDAAITAGALIEPGLTIGTLAARLGVPEHRLRALINQRLGYRNFSAFVNAHRIERAKAMLADPAHVNLPVLTIAMDLGYGSLAPFNRAFRDAVGQAPSDFRRVAFAEKS